MSVGRGFAAAVFARDIIIIFAFCASLLMLVTVVGACVFYLLMSVFGGAA